jgi:uncharacterized protein YdaU (DUF1376 family)
MSQFPSLPLFTDAFIADTGHLSAQETGAYLLLLMMAWRLPDCRIPDDDARLARWARVDARTWRHIKPQVMEFWTFSDGFWTQKRLTKEREFASKRANTARVNGARGGRPKLLNFKEAENPTGFPAATNGEAPNPNPNPSSNSSEASPLRDARENVWPPGYREQFWSAYPNKIGKQATFEAIDRVHKRGGIAFEVIMDGLARYVRDKPPDRHWCNPANWLTQGRWEDAPAPHVARTSPNSGGQMPRIQNGNVARLLNLQMESRAHESARDIHTDLLPAVAAAAISFRRDPTFEEQDRGASRDLPAEAPDQRE